MSRLKLIHIEGRKLMAVHGIPYWKEALAGKLLFISRSSGGGHVYILLPEDTVKEFKQKWECFYDEVKAFEEEHGRGKTFSLSYNIREAPKEPEKFFKFLSEYFGIATDYRIVRDTIEVAIAPHLTGKFIGKKGYKVKAMSKHLGYKIKVVPAIRVDAHPETDTYSFYIEEVKKNIWGVREIKKKKIYEMPKNSGWEPKFFDGYRDPHYGYCITDGYVAYWNLPEEVLAKLHQLQLQTKRG